MVKQVPYNLCHSIQRDSIYYALLRLSLLHPESVA
jgi:hypothetical protein